MKADLSVVGISGGNRQYRVAASATRAEVGEPIEFNGSYTSGVSDTNTVVLAADDTPVIGTDVFVGVCAKRFDVDSASAVTAQKAIVTVPIPEVTLIRGKAETKANIDTDAELLGVLWDVTLIDYNATGGSDSGELYTIKDAASADTSGLTIRDGNTSRGTLDVSIDARAMRADISS